MLEEHLKEKQTDKDNLWKCDKCKVKDRCFKWSEILSPPKHLCVCMSRLEYVMQPEFKVVKKKTTVVIEKELVIGLFAYELYFVIAHHGKDGDSGHYI